MASTTKATTAVPRRSSGGWLSFTVIVGGILAVFVFAGPQLRNLMAKLGNTPDDGNRPGSGVAASSEVDSKSSNLNVGDTDIGAKDLALKPKPATAPVVTVAATTTLIKPVAKEFPDDERASTILHAADVAFNELDWDGATSTALRVTGMKASPPLKFRAQSLARVCSQIKVLYEKLNQVDELSRNYLTDDMLVEFTDASGQTSLAVPIADISAKVKKVIVTGDPVVYINNTLQQTGKIAVMMKASERFMPLELDSSKMRNLKRANVVATKAERASEYTRRVQSLKSTGLQFDAVSVYQVARYGYQNRSDEGVAGLLADALKLDPDLANAIREDKASDLMDKVIFHVDRGNKPGADGFLASLLKNYPDTQAYQKARAYYDGQKAVAASLVMAAEKARQARIEKERDERLKMAMEAKDEEAQKRIAQEKQKPQIDDTPANEGSSGSEANIGNVADANRPGEWGKAYAMYTKGKALVAEGQAMGNTKGRDDKYHEALKLLMAALNIYTRLGDKDPKNQGLLAEIADCAFWRSACVKLARSD